MTRILILAVLQSLAAAEQSDSGRRPDTARRNDSISYSVARPQTIVQSTVEYRANPPMLDMYRPASTSSQGIVILVHGTAPATSARGPKDWAFFRSYAITLAQSGFTAIVPNHRLGLDSPQPELAEEDLRAVRSFLKNESDKHGREAASVEIVLFSGAGVLAAPILRGTLGPLCALALMYPTLDARLLPNYAHLPALLRAQYAASDVITSSAARRLPIFVGRGGRDEQIGVNRSVDDVGRVALAANLDLCLVNLPTGEHGFESKSTESRDRRTTEISSGG